MFFLNNPNGIQGTPTPCPIEPGRGDNTPRQAGMPMAVHPSYLLRLPDAQAKAREYQRFVAI